MNSREYVRGAYDELHASEALLGKVMDMRKNNESKKRNVLKVAAAFAAFAVAFVASNGICYAATGKTWVEKTIVFINGEKAEKDITWTQDGDTLVGKVEIDAEEGGVCEIVEFPDPDVDVEEVVLEFTDNNVDEFAADGDATGSYINENNDPHLMIDNGKVYLLVEDEIVDITDDWADGEATGEIKYGGRIASYKVTGNADEYQIELIEN